MSPSISDITDWQQITVFNEHQIADRRLRDLENAVKQLEQ
jgi:hypothetical protein